MTTAAITTVPLLKEHTRFSQMKLAALQIAIFHSPNKNKINLPSPKGSSSWTVPSHSGQKNHGVLGEKTSMLFYSCKINLGQMSNDILFPIWCQDYFCSTKWGIGCHQRHNLISIPAGQVSKPSNVRPLCLSQQGPRSHVVNLLQTDPRW